LHARRERRRVTRSVNVAQCRFGNARVSLVVALIRAAIGEIVLGGGEHVRRAQEVRRAGLALQSAHEHTCVRRDDRRIFRVALV
jgi:hypothetical protein